MKKHEDSFNEVNDNSDRAQNVKNNDVLQNEIHFDIARKSLLKIHKTGIFTRAAKCIKTVVSLIILIGITIVFNSCLGGYVASEQSYNGYDRPHQPSSSHIWISGDWNWNNQSQIYVQRSGYWEIPRQGQTYVEGYWQTTPHGKSWSKGHWQKNSRQKNNNHGNGNR